MNKLDKSGKMLLLSNIILAGFAVAVIFHYILGFYMGQSSPSNSFLFDAHYAFCDFVDLMPFVKTFAPYQTPSVWISYFPLAYILLFPLALIKNAYAAYLIFASGFMTFLVFANIKKMYCENLTKLENFQNIFVLTFLSYPVLYALNTGNTDMFLLILFAFSIYAFKSEKYLLSAILFAVQNAIKPFPILFLALFLYKKKYKEFFLSLLLTGLLIIGGFMLLKGNILDQILILGKNLTHFRLWYIDSINNDFSNTFSSSLFTPLKLILCRFSEHPVMSCAVFGKLYSALTLTLAAITAFFAWKEKTFWKQITLLTLFMLLVPQLLFDYKLIFLFVPIWLFVNSKSPSKFDLIYTVLFGLLFIPKNIVITNPQDALILAHLLPSTSAHWGYLSLSIFINPLIMLLFMALIISEQFSAGKETENE